MRRAGCWGHAGREPALEDSRAKKRGKRRSRRVPEQKGKNVGNSWPPARGRAGSAFPGPPRPLLHAGAPGRSSRAAVRAQEGAAPLGAAPPGAAPGAVGFCLNKGSPASRVRRAGHRRAVCSCTRVRLPGRRGEVARPPASSSRAPGEHFTWRRHRVGTALSAPAWPRPARLAVPGRMQLFIYLWPLTCPRPPPPEVEGEEEAGRGGAAAERPRGSPGAGPAGGEQEGREGREWRGTRASAILSAGTRPAAGGDRPPPCDSGKTEHAPSACQRGRHCLRGSGHSSSGLTQRESRKQEREKGCFRLAPEALRWAAVLFRYPGRRATYCTEKPARGEEAGRVRGHWESPSASLEGKGWVILE